MKELVRLRRVRTVTHYYVTDTIELDQEEFKALGAPQSKEAFMVWIAENGDALLLSLALSEITRLKLSKLNFYNEDRGQRVDESNLECL
ncbi:MAG: hypothetical protein HOH33_17340 [Verrucomicrobia bacterium]|jgi:hypothetical protein|nr:hypothetical protein [Verrucomicrobiota bacterium]